MPQSRCGVSPTKDRKARAAGRRCRVGRAVELVSAGVVYPRFSSSAPRSRRATRRPLTRWSTDYSLCHGHEPRDANFFVVKLSLKIS